MMNSRAVYAFIIAVAVLSLLVFAGWGLTSANETKQQTRALLAAANDSDYAGSQGAQDQIKNLGTTSIALTSSVGANCQLRCKVNLESKL